MNRTRTKNYLKEYDNVILGWTQSIPGTLTVTGDDGSYTEFEVANSINRGSTNRNGSITMEDVVDRQIANRGSELRKVLEEALSELKRSYDSMISELCKDTVRQIDNLKNAINQIDLDTKTRMPPWPTVCFLKREDFDVDTRVPHIILDQIHAKAVADMKANSQTWWTIQFFDNAVKYGLWDEHGEPIPNIMSRNRFRKVLRITQAEYRQRVALESADDYRGPHLVTYSNFDTKMKLFDAELAEQEIWDKIRTENAKLRAQLEAAALSRATFRKKQRDLKQGLLATLRMVRKTYARQKQAARESFESMYHDILGVYRQKIQLLRSTLQFNTYHDLRISERRPYRGRVPGSVVGMKKLKLRVEGSGLRETYESRDDVSLMLVRQSGNLTQPLGLTSQGISRGRIGELLGRLGRGDGPGTEVNVLAELFELKDIPSSVKNLKNVIQWARQSYTTKTLKGLSFATACEGYLEYIYGTKPTAEFALWGVQQVKDFIMWLRSVIDPIAFAGNLVPETQSASQRFRTPSLMSEVGPGMLSFETTHSLRLRWHGDAEAPDYGSPAMLSKTFVFDPIVDLIDFSHSGLLSVPAASRPIYDTSIKLFARPIVENKIKEIRRRLLYGVTWDNNLTEAIWNVVPFSFIADWFFGIGSALKKLDQLFVTGFRGLERLHEPWYRRVDNYYLENVVPTFEATYPTVSIEQGELHRSYSVDSGYVWSRVDTLRLGYRWKMLSSVDRGPEYRSVLRHRVDDDAIRYLGSSIYEAFERAFKIRGGSAHVLRIAPQILGLWGASTTGSGAKPRVAIKKAKPSSKVIPTGAVFHLDMYKTYVSALKAVGYQVK